jgi:hypothetical protein
MNRAAACLILLLAAAPAAAVAQSDGSPKDNAPSATERLQEGAAAIVDGLRLLMDQLQSYQPPEVLPNGDIIIRRRPPEGEEGTPPETGPDEKDDKSLKL